MDYYHLEYIKWWKRKIVTGQGYGLGIGGCKRLSPTANETWLGYNAFPVCVGQGPTVALGSKQVTDLLSRAYTWVWAQRRLVTLLSWVPALFGPTFRVVFGWRSKHRTESGTQERGLGVQVWTGT